MAQQTHRAAHGVNGGQPINNGVPLKGSYAADRAWADRLEPEIRRIVCRECADIICDPAAIDIRIAPDADDRKRCADYQITLTTGDIACRLRRADVGFRDWTIRHSRANGVPTEEAKLRAGHARWYLYGWTAGPRVPHWMLIDLDLARAGGALDLGTVRPNFDGQTCFRAIPVAELSDCIVRGEIDGRPLPWPDEDINDGFDDTIDDLPIPGDEDAPPARRVYR